MNRTIRTPAGAASVLLLTLVAAGCGVGTGDEGEASAEAVKIVVLGAFTGPSASQNVPILQGAKTAVKVLNDQGGIDGRPVELESEDDRGDIASMVNAAREAAADENVYAVMAGNGSPGAAAVEPVLAPAGIPVFSVGTSPAVTNENWPGFYRMNSNAGMTPALVLDLFETLEKSSLGVLWSNDDYGSGYEKAVQAAAKEAGIEVVASVPVSPGSSNLTPEINELREAGVDFVTTALLPAETLTTQRAVTQLGYDATMQINGADMAFPAQRALLGKNGAGVVFRYFDYPFDPILQTAPDTPADELDMSEEAKKFWTVWHEEFGDEVEINGNSVTAMPTYDWWSYDAIMMVAAAIENGATPQEASEEIDSIGSFELVADYELDETHEFHSPDDLSFARLEADGTITYNIK